MDKSILQNEDEILDLVRKDQLLDKGIDGYGRPIQPYYAPFTVNNKLFNRRPPQEADHVTLRDTGAYHNSFTTDYGSGVLEIFATDAKATGLERKYGDNIYGMTTESQKKLSEKFIRPALYNYLKSIFR